MRTRGNHKPNLIKILRKVIMLRSKLKDRFNESKDTYIKYINNNVHLNKDSKYSYCSNVDIRKKSKPFWNVCKPYFTSKHTGGEIIY